MLSNKLCSKRRINIYFKCFCILSLIVFYFIFLFRESTNAFHTIKNNIKTKQHNYNNDRGIKIKLQNIKDNKIPNKSKSLDFDINNNNNNNELTTTKHLSTLNPIYEYSEELHSATEKDLMSRKAHLWEVCVKENIIGIYPPNAWEFFLSQGHNLVWCNVFKAASSTWMYYFNILAGYDIKYLQRTKVSPLELARKRFPRPKLSELKDALSNAVSFLTVREPFERLLSAYRDKLEGCHNKYYKVLAKQIVKLFRKKSEQKKYNSGPTFKEFLQYLIQNYKNGKQFDEHWTPIYRFCTPCSINFTLIVKVETFQRDSEFIIRQTGLEPLLLGKMPKKMMRKISNQSLYSTGSLINRYFSQIDRDILEEIIKIYRLDFELFGYNLTKYYDIVQPPKDDTDDKQILNSTISTIHTINI